MQESEFEQRTFFRSIAESGARALLIGRRALIVLGAPVGTFDYDFWIHFDDIERFNAALVTLGLIPNCPPGDARQRGRYVLENSERVDVLVARVHPTVDGQRIAFDDLWARHKRYEVSAGVWIDLMATKRFGARPKDAEDLRFLARRPEPAIVRQLRADAERQLSVEEFNAWVNAPMTDDERDEIDSLIEWFTRRYPTPEARLEYARRAARDLAAIMPSSAE